MLFPREFHCPRRGLSLLEVLLASVMLLAFLVAMFNFFISTQRRYVRSEAYVKASTLVQMVVERIRAHISQDPEFLRTLTGNQRWTFSGCVVEPSGATTPGLALSPFFKHLFAPPAADLYTADAQTSLPESPPAADKDLKELFTDFRDYVVDVTIEDDVDLEPAPSGPPSALKEMVKRIRVGARRGSLVRSGGRDPQEFVLTARVLTPTESLSDAAAEELHRGFEAQTLDSAWDEFFLLVGQNPFFRALSSDGRRLLADCYLFLGYMNTEFYLTEGTTLGEDLVLRTVNPSRAIQGWIRLFDVDDPALKQYGVILKQLSRLRALEVQIVVDTFKLVLPVLRHMDSEHARLKPEIDDLKTMLESTLDRVLTLERQTVDNMGDYREAEDQREDAVRDLERAQREIQAEEARLQRNPDPDRGDRRDLEEAQARAQEAMRRRDQAQQRMDSEMGQIQGGLQQFAALVQQKGRSLMNYLRLVTLLKLVHDFFNRKTGDGSSFVYRSVVDRLTRYPTRFRALVDRVEQNLADHLRATTTVTPYEKMITCQRMVEFAKLRQIYDDSDSSATSARLGPVAGGYGSTMRDLNRYMTSGELYEDQRLRMRHRWLRERLVEMKNLQDPANPANLYRRIVSRYEQGGELDQFLELYTRVAQEIRLEGGGVLSRMQRQLQASRGSVDYVTNATANEVVAAMTRLGY